MPELPEVETVKRGLSAIMLNAVIEDIAFSEQRLRFPYPQGLRQYLTGARILDLSRRGKYISVSLSNDSHLIIHLGMSGSYRIEPREGVTMLQHDHMILTLDNDAIVTYNDPRRFGFVDLVFGDALTHYKPFTLMGPEPLSPEFHAAYLYERLKSSRSPIKQILLDQSIVAGLGNIYVCEALYRARIHPKRLASQIALQRFERLVGHIRDVLQEAIDSGGSSLKDHKGVDGTMGYFQHRFDVYGREGAYCGREECQSLSKPCIRRITQSGRSTFYCVNTQT